MPSVRRGGLGSRLVAGAWLTGGFFAALAVSAQNQCAVDNVPIAIFAPTGPCPSTQQGWDCTFDSSDSTDLGGGIVARNWSFGDGATASTGSENMSHTYVAGGLYLVKLTVIDTIDQAGTAVRVVQIGAANGPLAIDDQLSANRGVATTILTAELLANDASGVVFEGIVSPPTHGNLMGGGTSYQYTSHSAFEGDDSFTYSVRDFLDSTNGTATVTISVLRAPPVAHLDEFTTGFATPIDIARSQLLANDSPGAVFVRAEGPTHGTLALVPDPANPTAPPLMRFTPASGFAGIATFQYLISWDGQPPYERGLVYIEVTDGPPFVEFFFTCENRLCTVVDRSHDDIGISDYFLEWGDGDSAHYLREEIRSGVTHTYGKSGRYVATLTVTDTAGHTTSGQREALANTQPIAVNDTATTERDIAVTIPVLVNDSDADGDPLRFFSATVSHPGAGYQIVALGTSWGLRITPPDSFVGTLAFTYELTDLWGGVMTGAGTLTVTQWTSITDALGEQLPCQQHCTLHIQRSLLLANDYDSDGDVLSIESFDTTILMGSLDCSNKGFCIYQAPSGGSGVTFFKYTVSDPAGHRDTATVRIYVSVAGNPPTFVDDYFTTPRNTPKLFSIQEVVQNDIEPDGDTLTVTIASGARDYGSIACTSPMYHCTYTPNPGFVGPDRFLYTASDMMTTQGSAHINILTLPPVTPTLDAREDMLLAAQNQQLFFHKTALTGNDYNPAGGDPVTVSAVDSTGLFGILNCDATSCTFNPGINFLGTTRFQYTAMNGRGGTDTAVVKIRVGNGNTAPVLATDAFTTPKNTQLRFSIFDLLRNDYDPDNDPLNVGINVFGATKGNLNCGIPQYWCTYTPHSNVTGVDTIVYNVTDVNTISSSFTITITP